MTQAPAAQQASATPAATRAGLGVRFVARVIDAVIVSGLLGGLGAVMGFGYDWLAVGTALVFGYFALTTAYLGGTVAKRLLGLRVLGPDGGRPSLGQAAAREAFTVLGAVPFAGPLLALIAWIVIALKVRASPTGQGPHDRLGGGTRVVARGEAQ